MRLKKNETFPGTDQYSNLGQAIPNAIQGLRSLENHLFGKDEQNG